MSTIWITGLSASGKSTIAYALAENLRKEGRACYVLDGDNIRHKLNKDLGFSSEDRNENIRRSAEVAALMNDAGLIVITAFISPLHHDRKMAKEIIGKKNYKEIFLSTSLAVCEERDPKGLYKQARSGNIKDFTGITSPYEKPTDADLEINTSKTDIDKAVTLIKKLIP